MKKTKKGIPLTVERMERFGMRFLPFSVFGIASAIYLIKTRIGEIGYAQTCKDFLLHLMIAGLIVIACTHFLMNGEEEKIHDRDKFRSAYNCCLKIMTVLYFAVFGAMSCAYMIFKKPYNPDYISALPIAIAIIGIVLLCQSAKKYASSYCERQELQRENARNGKEPKSKIKNVLLEICYVVKNIFGLLGRLIVLLVNILCVFGVIALVYIIRTAETTILETLLIITKASFPFILLILVLGFTNLFVLGCRLIQFLYEKNSLKRSEICKKLMLDVDDIVELLKKKLHTDVKSEINQVLKNIFRGIRLFITCYTMWASLFYYEYFILGTTYTLTTSTDVSNILYYITIPALAFSAIAFVLKCLLTPLQATDSSYSSTFLVPSHASTDFVPSTDSGSDKEVNSNCLTMEEIACETAGISIMLYLRNTDKIESISITKKDGKVRSGCIHRALNLGESCLENQLLMMMSPYIAHNIQGNVPCEDILMSVVIDGDSLWLKCSNTIDSLGNKLMGGSACWCVIWDGKASKEKLLHASSEEINELVESCKKKCYDILTKHKDSLRLVAGMLLINIDHTLSGEDFEHIMKQCLDNTKLKNNLCEELV